MSILNLIGNTPLLKLEKLNPFRKIEIYAKAEWFNPGGSVKDRPALKIIETAEKDGRLKVNRIILDSSSGNTAIAYGMIGAVKGYRVEMVVPQNVSAERKKILLAYGVKLIITDPMEGSDGAIRLARKMAEENPGKYFYADQYNNPANPLAHYETTAPEIIRQTEGRISHFVAGMGTSGTLMGTGKSLREFNPGVKIIAVQPDFGLHGLEGLKHMPSSLKPGIYDERFPDEIIPIKTEDAYECTRKLALMEGLLVGQSSGAALWATLEVGKRISQRSESACIVTIFPDGGDRYLSTRLWG